MPSGTEGSRRTSGDEEDRDPNHEGHILVDGEQ